MEKEEAASRGGLLGTVAYGVTGAAAAYALANLAVYVVLWRYVRYRTGIDCSVFAVKTGLSGMKRYRHDPGRVRRSWQVVGVNASR